MLGRKELDNAIIYIVNDYSERENVSKDLENGNRVVIISSEQDVLSFYGLILEQYGQYNLYLEQDLNDLDDEYFNVVENQDVSKEESAIYVGKSLSQMVSETIDELSLNPQQKRIMTICKEILKNNNDIKSEATISLLNDKLRKERSEKENLIKELNELKAGEIEDKSSQKFTKSTINLDALSSTSQVMYIRELGYVPNLNTCINAYATYLRKMKNKQVICAIIDNRLFNMIYNDDLKIDSQDNYIINRNKITRYDRIVADNIYPLMINEIYKNRVDLVILIDRIINNQDIVKGKNVHKYIAINNYELLKYVNNLAVQDFKYICSSNLDQENAIYVDIKNKDISTPQLQLYWYSKLLNKDNKLVFDIFNEFNGVK